MLKLVKARTKWVYFESAIPLLDHSPGSLVKFLWSPFDSVPTIRISFDTITHCTAEELIDRLTKGLPYNIPAGNFDSGDGGHGNFTGAREVVPVHALHQVLDIGRIMAEYVVRYSLCKIA